MIPLKEDEMAFQCSGNPWTSTTKSDAPGSVNVPDGTIHVDPEDGSGAFLGTHISHPPDTGAAGLILGRCRDNGGLTGHIEFDRRIREGNQIYNIHYSGDFSQVSANLIRTSNGRYQKRRRGREAVDTVDRTLAEDDGTWVGEKPIT
jgi:hypothetical protein